MDGGIGPSGGGCPRDMRELIPGKHKTVLLDEPPGRGIIGGLFFGIPGLLFLWGACLMFGEGVLKHGVGKIGGAVSMGAFGGLLTFPLWLILYVIYDSSRCLPIDVLRERLNVSEEELQQVAREKGILARYTIMGRDLYRPADFDRNPLDREHAS